MNGKLVENPDEWINFKEDEVTVDGRPLSAEQKIYLLLYKPKGFVTTAKDPDGRPTVYDLIKDVKFGSPRSGGSISTPLASTHSDQ